MSTYSGRVVRESGGSVLSFASGASLNFAAGAALAGTIGGTPTFAEAVTFSGVPTFTGGVNIGATTAACVASSQLKIGYDIAASGTAGVFQLADFGNGIKFFLSKNSTGACASGSPGSLLLHVPDGTAAGSGVRLYIKAGDNNPASGNWVKFKLDLASS